MNNYELTKEDFDRDEFEKMRIELLSEQDTINNMQKYKGSVNKGASFFSKAPGIAFALIAICMVISSFSKNDNTAAIFGMTSIFLFLLMFGLIIGVAILLVVKLVRDQKPIGEMAAYYKEHVVKPLLKAAFPRLEYLPQFDLKQDSKYQPVINDINYTNQPTEDRISGEYRGVYFEQTDVYMDKYETLEDETSTVHGSVFYMKLPKTVQGDVVMIGKRFPKNEASTRLEVVKRTPMNGSEAIAKAAKSVEKYYGLPRVHMENMWFEEHFFTYAENPEEAFYVLTPPFMEQIQRLYGKYQLRIRIHGNELFLMKERATFEFDPYKSLDIDYETINMRDDMLDLYRIIDCLI